MLELYVWGQAGLVYLPGWSDDSTSDSPPCGRMFWKVDDRRVSLRLRCSLLCYLFRSSLAREIGSQRLGGSLAPASR